MKNGDVAKITVWWNTNPRAQVAAFAEFKHKRMPRVGLVLHRSKGIHLDTFTEVHSFMNLLMSVEPEIVAQYLLRDDPPVTAEFVSHKQLMTSFEPVDIDNRIPSELELTAFEWFAKAVIEARAVMMEQSSSAAQRWKEVFDQITYMQNTEPPKHRISRARVEPQPPGWMVKTAEHHWLEQLDCDGHSNGFVVLQWNPGAHRWSHSGNVGTGMYVDTTYWRYHSHCPIPD